MEEGDCCQRDGVLTLLPEGSRLKTVNKGPEGRQYCLRAGGWRVLPKGWRLESGVLVPVSISITHSVLDNNSSVIVAKGNLSLVILYNLSTNNGL